MKVRRKRIRFDRILIVVAIIVLLVFLVKFGIYTIKNFIIYNEAKSSDTISVGDSSLNIWNKTIDYIKENKKNITINYHGDKVTIKASDIKNGMNVKLDGYNKTIDEPLFNNVDSYYIKSNDILNMSSKISISLPGYLRGHDIVDVYKVKNKKISLYKSAFEVVDGSVTFRVDKDTDYFITYINLKSIKASSVILDEGTTSKISMTFNPNNASDLSIKYEVEDESIATVVGGKVTGLKPGKTVVKIISKSNPDVEKEINITVNEVAKPEPVPTPEPTPTPSTKKTSKGYDIVEKDGLTYIDGILIVNKTYSLPSTYNPGGLTDEFQTAFDEMQEAAAEDGIDLFIVSGFRDYEYQAALYDKYVSFDGKEVADTYSARAGHSEHQTGYAADINSADESFEGTPEAIWLDQNCYKYGFIVRYQKGKDDITGYIYEPWHLRYIGKEKAKKIYESGLTLEEYYGFDSKYED